MDKVINKFLEKVSKYDIFVNFIPGIVLYYLMDKMVGINLCTNNVIVDICLFYFFGICASMFANLLFCIKWIKNIFKVISYENFVKIDNRNDEFKRISQRISMYKAFLGSEIISLIFYIKKLNLNICNTHNNFILLDCKLVILLFVCLITFVYLKAQFNYINIRYDKIKKDEDKKRKRESKTKK